MSGLIVASVLTVALSTTSPVVAGEDHVVEPGDTLGQIAADHGSSVRAIAEANGIDNADLIQPGAVLVIPGGADGSAASVHVIGAGETLASIAVRYGTSISDLVAANALANPDLIIVGQTLQVAGATHGDLGPQGGGGSQGGGSEEPAAGGTGGAASADLTYEIRSGDTIANIATAFGISSRALLDANSLSNPDVIQIGQNLTIPAGDGSAGGDGAGGAMVCPVPGGVYEDDYLYVKPTGRVHQGNDILAPEGTTVQAPAAGTTEFIDGTLGGLQFWLYGFDGNLYIGTHLSAFGPNINVAAGDVIGYVGDTGNAIGGPPHLHFEVHVDGEPINPFPLLNAAC